MCTHAFDNESEPEMICAKSIYIAIANKTAFCTASTHTYSVKEFAKKRYQTLWRRNSLTKSGLGYKK